MRHRVPARRDLPAPGMTHGMLMMMPGGGVDWITSVRRGPTHMVSALVKPQCAVTFPNEERATRFSSTSESMVQFLRRRYAKARGLRRRGRA